MTRSRERDERDLARRERATPSPLADAISNVLDPAWVVLALIGTIAAASTPSWGAAAGWAALAVAFTVVVPYAALAVLVRSGRVDDRHLVRRDQRLVPALVALAGAAAGVALLWRLGAPRDVLAVMLAMAGGVLVLGLATLVAKVSLHTAVIAGAVAVLVLRFGWWTLALAPLAALVGWARWRAGRHTVVQIVTGGLLGALVAGGVFALAREPVRGTLAEPAPTHLRAVEVDLPGPVSALAGGGEGLWIGTYDAAVRPAAGLTWWDGASGTGQRVPVHALSSYAFGGQWRALAVRESALLGIAGQVGGAHGNVRWTIWRGDRSGVTEEEQEFWTFGGYDMGGLSGAGYVGADPLVVGGWKSRSTGLDIATWHASGATWARDDVPAALASSPEVLRAATAVIPRGPESVLLGSTTHLGAGFVTVAPTVWISAGGGARPVWTAQELPLPGGVSGQGRAEAGHCPGHGPCLLAGRVAGRLVAWRGDLPAAVPLQLPGVALADTDRVLGTGVTEHDLWIAVQRAAGPVLLRARDSRAAADLRWSVEAPPAARLTAAAAFDGRFCVATGPPARLWCTPT